MLIFSFPRTRSLAAGALVLLLVAPPKVGAQAPATDGWDTGRWRFGPLAVTPRIELRNLGWDSNVFNETENPKSDFTTTVAAPIDWWFRFGRVPPARRRRLRGRLLRGIRRTRAASTNATSSRCSCRSTGSGRTSAARTSSTNDRPGYEINDRVRHTETGVNGGIVVRLTSRLDLDVSGRETTYEYRDQNYAGNPYSRHSEPPTTTNYGAQTRYKLSSLTTLTLLADSVRERYTGTPERDNDGYRILPGVEFGEYALITGKAQVGYRKLDTIAQGMPDFSGLVANAELSYVLGEVTRFTVGVSRDIHFSYEVTEPFYVQPGLTLSVTQQVGGPWDVQARGSWYRLDYQRAATAPANQAPERVDRYQTFGGGVGYRLGRDIRVGFNVDYFRRDSTAARSGLRWGSRRPGRHLCAQVDRLALCCWLSQRS